MQGDPSYFLFERMLKRLKERRQGIQEALSYGAVQDYTAFRELRASLSEIETTEQDLRDLLKRIDDETEVD